MIRLLLRYGEVDSCVFKYIIIYYIILYTMSSWIKSDLRKKNINDSQINNNNRSTDNSVSISEATYNTCIFNTINKCNSINNVVNEIPKIAFTFWEGDQFSYLHLLTIKSFAFYNPDFKIIIYNTPTTTNTMEWKTPEHKISIVNNLTDINLLKSIKNVEFITIDMEEYYPGINNISSVYKSDIIRIIKLYEHGGIWIDFDILFNKKLSDNVLQIPQNNIGIFTYHNYLAIGYILSHPANPLLELLLHDVSNILNNKEYDNYQVFGTRIWSKLANIPVINTYITILPNTIVYPYHCYNLDLLYKTNNDLLTENTTGIHWYNGADITKHYINNTNFDMIDPNRSVMDKYVYNVIKDLDRCTL